MRCIKKEIKTLDMVNHAQCVINAGYSALKTKIHYFDASGGTGYFPCLVVNQEHQT